jgi:uncharacterized alkaline shock family protein YloU
MGRQSTRSAQRQESPLKTERGNTSISNSVVAQVAGMAAQEVEGVQLGSSTTRAVGGIVDSVTGGTGYARGVTVEVGEIETAIELSVVVEYGRSIPQVSEAVRTNVISRVENLVGLKVNEVNITVNDVLLPGAGE